MERLSVALIGRSYNGSIIIFNVGSRQYTRYVEIVNCLNLLKFIPSSFQETHPIFIPNCDLFFFFFFFF